MAEELSTAERAIDRSRIEAELLAAYGGRGEDGFLRSVLESLTDPIHPVNQQQQRRFHPTLVLTVCMAGIVLVAFVYFSLAS